MSSIHNDYKWLRDMILAAVPDCTVKFESSKGGNLHGCVIRRGTGRLVFAVERWADSGEGTLLISLNANPEKEVVAADMIRQIKEMP